jgi:hypothetical protein
MSAGLYEIGPPIRTLTSFSTYGTENKAEAQMWDIFLRSVMKVGLKLLSSQDPVWRFHLKKHFVNAETCSNVARTQNRWLFTTFLQAPIWESFIQYCLILNLTVENCMFSKWIELLTRLFLEWTSQAKLLSWSGLTTSACLVASLEAGKWPSC